MPNKPQIVAKKAANTRREDQNRIATQLLLNATKNRRIEKKMQRRIRQLEVNYRRRSSSSPFSTTSASNPPPTTSASSSPSLNPAFGSPPNSASGSSPNPASSSPSNSAFDSPSNPAVDSSLDPTFHRQIGVSLLGSF